jgi:hypothetical protein
MAQPRPPCPLRPRLPRRPRSSMVLGELVGVLVGEVLTVLFGVLLGALFGVVLTLLLGVLLTLLFGVLELVLSSDPRPRRASAGLMNSAVAPAIAARTTAIRVVRVWLIFMMNSLRFRKRASAHGVHFQGHLVEVSIRPSSYWGRVGRVLGECWASVGRVLGDVV